MSDSRNPSNTEMGSSRAHTVCLHSRGASSASTERGTENPHKRVTFGRAESALPVIACNFYFVKTSGMVTCVTADEGATCMVVLDVDTGHMKAVLVAGKSVTALPGRKVGNAALSSSFDA